MIDRDRALSLPFAPLTFEVERGRLRAFARSTGETNPIYRDVDAARAAGHPDLPAPPTFFFTMGLERDEPLGYLGELGIDLRFVLHGEQAFDYRQVAYAGDTLVLQDRITDVYDKRGGAMEFIVKETAFHRAGTLVATAKSVLVVRDPEAAA
ncbi:MaoC family dehydratase N-terminal domain-containing protein [Dactylosporangium sp. CA-233914]|uniref:MaoC family dehydratase N-terminal domain-containing protein n=1 Tax=Dactylosporangium sp. CA-233914 TaxID=3239934 RepID=UPI003D8F2B04